MPRKYGPIGNGDGYSTAGKESFDNRVVVSFNYGNLALNAEKANQIANQYLKEIRSDFSAALSNKSMPGLIQPTIKSGKYKQILLLPGNFRKETEEHFNEASKMFAEEMKSEIKQVIRTTAGRRGPGRIDTHRMIDSVFGRRTKFDKSAGIIESSGGWLDNWYKYFGFQEEGTYQIKPMHAIPHTAMIIFARASKYVRMYTARMGKTGFRGFR